MILFTFIFALTCTINMMNYETWNLNHHFEWTQANISGTESRCETEWNFFLRTVYGLTHWGEYQISQRELNSPTGSFWLIIQLYSVYNLGISEEIMF